VTKLSLLLKVLEGSRHPTGAADAALLGERVLPDLDGNVKCGNSLIGPDFFDGRLDLDEDERRRINAFDWQAEFPQVFPPSPARGRGVGGEGRGGFDAVIGNPPYVSSGIAGRIQGLLSNRTTRPMTASPTSTPTSWKRASRLLREGGLFSIIVSSSFLRASYGARPARDPEAAGGGAAAGRFRRPGSVRQRQGHLRLHSAAGKGRQARTHRGSRALPRWKTSTSATSCARTAIPCRRRASTPKPGRSNPTRTPPSSTRLSRAGTPLGEYLRWSV
jgi:hypothetical protein